MKKEISPESSPRAKAFQLWMQSSMPMVTMTKTFDVAHLVKIAKRKNLKFNMLLCWCIGKTASQFEEFYTIPEQGKLYLFDRLAINVIVNNKEGDINSCDIPFTNDLEQFAKDYDQLTQSASESCQSSFLDDYGVIGTSAMIETEFDSIVNQYTQFFCNPYIAWGRYHKGWFSIKLPISFQFHHVQMDGGHAARFLQQLQNEILSLR